ncbi:MAG: hypothetical protein J7L91_00090 [Candidatus Korarchaeota archaeon]|nr:hypothetical protein [Candidatus Korarchaeota archaeon]
MRWKSHIAIAKAIGKALNLPEDMERELIEGSIDPDRFPDTTFMVGRLGRVYASRVPHHVPPIEVIMEHVWRARLAYLSGERLHAMRSLGRALHYIQDACLAGGFASPLHDDLESTLSSVSVPERAVREGFLIAACSPHFVERLLENIKPEEDPKRILYRTSLYSAAVARAVLCNEGPSAELLEEFRKAKERHSNRILFALGTLTLGLLGAVLVSLTYLFIGAFVAWLALKDKRYEYLKEEMEWFGPRVAIEITRRRGISPEEFR